jgi:hypothetical protein
MAFQSSTQTRVLAGALNLSCEVRDVSVSFDVDALDTSTICDTARTYIPGRTTASLSALARSTWTPRPAARTTC